MNILLLLMCLATPALAAKKTYQLSLSTKLKDHKGKGVGAETLSAAIVDELLKDLEADKGSAGPGAQARKKLRWALAKKLSGAGVVTIDEVEVDVLKGPIGSLPMRLYGPLLDALDE